MTESLMLGRLNRETKQDQLLADNDRLAVLEVVADRQRYAAFLERVFGFEAPLEAALLLTRELHQWIDMRDRGHIRLLRADLHALGVRDPNALPRSPGIAPFRHAADALGWAYVIERNALLHTRIAPHLRSPASTAGYAYLRRRSTGQHLRELGLAMDRTSKDVECADRIVAAAKAAYRVQHSWYEVAAPPHQQVA